VKRTQKQNKSCKKLNKAEAKQNQKLVNEKVFLALTECIDPKQILLEIPFKKSANQLKVLKAVLEIWQGEIPQVKNTYTYICMYKSWKTAYAIAGKAVRWDRGLMEAGQGITQLKLEYITSIRQNRR